MSEIVTQGSTLYDKIFEAHIVCRKADGVVLLYIDRHMIHEVSSPQAFEGLRSAGRHVRRSECVLATTDHNTPTTTRKGFRNITQFIKDKESRLQCETLEQNVKNFGITYFGLNDERQGIVHVIGPEQGFTIPGATIVCGDSHTSTHGAFGTLSYGIGTSEVEHVLATQTLLTQKSKNMKIEINGELLPGVSSKDIILHTIGRIGTSGAAGYVVEFCGSTIRNLGMEARMTICNMSIEAGARAGLIAPDWKTLQYIKGRRFAPDVKRNPEEWHNAVRYWHKLKSDADAFWDREIVKLAEHVASTVSWGTSPEQVVSISGVVPSPSEFPTEDQRRGCEHALRYMDLRSGVKMTDIVIDKVFIGSCTNSRIEDLRLVAYLVKGKAIAPSVHAIVVPGSGLVKRQAEKEGLDRMLIAAGFEWRESGCSMCVGLNEDILLPGQRCASTTNRNFEGRQGSGGRTHLVSPALAAAAALEGRLADVKELKDYDKAIERAKSGEHPIEIMIGQLAIQDDVMDEPGRQAHNAPSKSTSPNSNGVSKFTILKGIAAPMPRSNVDTDVILPKQFCKTIKRTGLAKGLFYGWRFDDNGCKREDFILNRGPFDTAKIMVAGPNFGCGSSREHAPWALLDFGIKCIVANSFAEIFYNNAFKNGMLPLVMDDQLVLDRLMEEATAGRELEIDLTQNIINDNEGQKIASFRIDEHRRHCLLNGIDDIATTLQDEAMIAAYEGKMSVEAPWLNGPCTSTKMSGGETPHTHSTMASEGRRFVYDW